MATLVIDTHAFVQGLTKAGMSQRQAEAIAEGFKQIDLDQLVTKQDLRAAIQDLRVEISNLKSEMLKWAVPLLLGQVALFAVIVQWLVHS